MIFKSYVNEKHTLAPQLRTEMVTRTSIYDSTSGMQCHYIGYRHVGSQTVSCSKTNASSCYARYRCVSPYVERSWTEIPTCKSNEQATLLRHSASKKQLPETRSESTTGLFRHVLLAVTVPRSCVSTAASPPGDTQQCSDTCTRAYMGCSIPCKV